MDDLFSVSADPLEPGLDDPTPLHLIAALTGSQRRQRVEALIQQAKDIYQMGVEEAGDRKIMTRAILFSGGNDSTVLWHLFRDVADCAIHANTGIGVEETRQFVRDTCQQWGKPLLERHPPTSYRELVLAFGFPGPGHHYKMFQQLKERALRLVRKQFVKHGRRQRVIYIAGRRRAESARRKDIPLVDVVDSIIHVSPLAMWTSLDMTTYRLMMGDVPVNQMAVKLGMSGECLCGAFAKPGELETIREHAPAAAAQIEALQEEVRAAGHVWPYDTWGHGQGKATEKVGLMCTSCTTTDPLLGLLELEAELNAGKG